MLLQLLPSPCLLHRGPDGLPPRGGLRRGADGLPPRGGLRRVLCASISRVQPSRTVDFESKRPLKWTSLFRQLSLPGDSPVNASVVLQKWEKHQRKLIKWEVCRVAKELRKYRHFKIALDVYEWISAQDRFTFNSSDAAILLDLIYKVRGLSSAEIKFKSFPEALKDKRTYGSLLNVYANAKEKEKAEGLLETMRKRRYLTDSLVYNVIMTMYMNLNEQKNVFSLITEMLENDIRLDSYSFNIWITTCAAIGDMEEMERILELMNADKFVSINWTTYTTLATMLVRLGQMEKAVKYMKEAECRMTGRDRSSYHCLITLYGHAGKKDDVYRIWHQYNSQFGEAINFGYCSMLTSLTRLGDVEGAETIYREWLSSAKRHDPRVCNILLSYYDKCGELSKAERCLEEMLNVGGIASPATLEILASLYIKHKQILKALPFLKEAASMENRGNYIWQPRVDIVENFLVVCAEQGDHKSIKSLIEMLEELKCLEIAEYKSVVSAHAETALHG